jgi:hypothetical protein
MSRLLVAALVLSLSGSALAEAPRKAATVQPIRYRGLEQLLRRFPHTSVAGSPRLYAAREVAPPVASR